MQFKQRDYSFGSLLVNLFCFGASTTYHYLPDSAKQLPSFYILLDYIGIILRIWGTSVSVLLLEATGSGNINYIVLGVTLGGVICATYLITWPREKRERVLVIGGFGGLALCSVSLYNAAFSSIYRLAAIYIFMGLVNGIGGWFYSRGSIQGLSQRSPKSYTVSEHSLMHLCSLISSIFHATILVSSVCTWQTWAPGRMKFRSHIFLWDFLSCVLDFVRIEIWREWGVQWRIFSFLRFLSFFSFLFFLFSFFLWFI